MVAKEFQVLFQALTETQPFPWLTEMYERFASGKFPEIVVLPTGLGKTSINVIRLIALLQQPHTIPQRLVYIVNRRTVVDQTTAEAERLCRVLSVPVLSELCSVPASLCALPLPSPNTAPPAIRTLRGQYVANHERNKIPLNPVQNIFTNLSRSNEKP